MADASSSSSSGRNSMLWMMVALLGGFALLVGGALFLAQRVLKTMSVKQHRGNEATLQTPLGELRVEHSTSHGPGLPVYPQAALVMPGDNVHFELPADRHYQIRAAKYHTSDSREAVDAWYQSHLGPEFERQGPGEKHVSVAVEQYKLSSEDVVFVAGQADEARIISLADENSGTGITLVRIGRLHAQ